MRTQETHSYQVIKIKQMRVQRLLQKQQWCNEVRFIYQPIFDW